MYMPKKLKKTPQILYIQLNEFSQLSTVVYYLSKNRNRKLRTLQKPSLSKSKTTSKLLHSTPNYPLYVLITVDLSIFSVHIHEILLITCFRF